MLLLYPIKDRAKILTDLGRTLQRLLYLKMPAIVALNFFSNPFLPLKETNVFWKSKTSVKFLPFEGKKYYSVT